MTVSRISLALFASASLSGLASATDVTAIDGSQGWVGYGFTNGGNANNPVGTASIVSTYGGDGSLQLTGDRSRVGIGLLDDGTGTAMNFGTLGALAGGSMGLDLLRNASSQTSNPNYNIAVRLTFAGGVSLTWESSNNGYGIGSTFTSRTLSDGNWFLRAGGAGYDQVGGWLNLDDWAAGLHGTAPDAGLNVNSQIVGLSFLVGSGISTGTPGNVSFIGAVDNLNLTFAQGVNYNYNFRSVTTTPAPAALSAFAIGLAGRLRRRKRA